MASRRDIAALRRLRLELEESAGLGWPASAAAEILLLRDVCGALRLTVNDCAYVLGDRAYDYAREMVLGLIPAGYVFPLEG